MIVEPLGLSHLPKAPENGFLVWIRVWHVSLGKGHKYLGHVLTHRCIQVPGNSGAHSRVRAVVSVFIEWHGAIGGCMDTI